MSRNLGANFRLVFFLVSALSVGFMLWKLHQANRVSKPPASYRQFLEFAGQGQIQDARIYPENDTTEIFVFLRNHPQPIRCEGPTADLAKLVKELMDTGATVEFSRTRRFDPWVRSNLAPFILLLVAFIVLLRRQKATT